MFFAGQQDDVTPLLAQCPIFVMISDRQGCPNASLEAMAMGRPVIANRSGGVEEQIEDGVNGFLIDTPEEMAERVLALQKDKRLLRRWARGARQGAHPLFLDAMVARYVRLLDGEG